MLIYFLFVSFTQMNLCILSILNLEIKNANSRKYCVLSSVFFICFSLFVCLFVKTVKIKSFVNLFRVCKVYEVSHKFCSILLTWGTIQQLRMVLPRSWKGQTTLNCKMPSLPDTLQVLLAEFTSLAQSIASESTVLGLLDFAWSSWFLQPEWTFLNHLITILWSTVSLFVQFESCKAWVAELDYVVRSTMRLSNHTQCEAMHDVSAFKLTRY